MRTAANDVAQPLVEPLTRREAQMLALLAAGYSRPEIAAHLTLALSSVKFHLHHLYAKLGVSTKRLALSRAAVLGLLAPPLPVDLPADPSGRTGAPVPKHNLPMSVTRFFGREVEIAQLRERLDENRLVTLTGPGGVGKSRLALRTAEELLPGFTDGVWLVELAPLSDPGLVAHQVIASLGLRDAPGRPPLETLTAFLRDRQALLVLDNCEHLLTACAELAGTLLHTCPRVRLLVSSREPLGLAGEALFIVPSLAFPDPDHLPPVDHLTDYPAVSLFLDRARLVLPDYRVAAHNGAALARICQRLDGLPLALEMAASRLRLLNTSELAARLENAFHVLTSGSRTALPKHRTLQATLDWGYDLLTEPERWLLRRLSVFVGGCTLEAAETVCSGDGLPANQVLDHLGALVAKSLIVADRRPGDEPRYRMLETVRQYAQLKLQAAGEGPRLCRRHRDHYLGFAESTILERYWADWPTGGRKLVDERDNFRRALEWSFSDETDLEAGPRLMLWTPSAFSDNDELVRWNQRAVAWCESHAEFPVKLHINVLMVARVANSDPATALAWAKRAVELSRGLGSDGKTWLFSCLLSLGWIHLFHFDEVEQALAVFDEAEALLRELGPGAFSPSPPFDYRRRTCALHEVQSLLANRQSRYQDAKMLASECIRLYEEVGEQRSTGIARRYCGIACLNLGEYDQAHDQLLESLRLADGQSPIGRDGEVVAAQYWLAALALRQGNLAQAREHCRASLQLAAEIRDYPILAVCFGLLASIAAQQGKPARTARLAGAAQALNAQYHRKPAEDSSLDTLLPGWRDGPDGAALIEAFEAGRALTVEQAVALVLHEPFG